MLDLPFVQHVLVNHHPASLLSLLVRIQFVRQLPQMLTGVIKIDNLNGTGEMLFGNVPNPFRSIPHHDLLFRAALASNRAGMVSLSSDKESHASSPLATRFQASR